MVNTAYALNAYAQTKVTTTAKPVDLVIMLYDGAIEFLNKACTALKIRETRTKLKYMDKALAILEELLNSLNMELGGQVAVNLQELYTYMMTELVLANLHNDVAKINMVIDLLKEVKSGWVAIKDME